MSNPLVAGSRSLEIIELVASRTGGASFTILANDLGISPASLTRLLKMLLLEEWIRQDARTSYYIAGNRLTQLGRSMRTHSLAGDIVAPIVRELAERSGHSACYVVLQPWYFMIQAKTEKRRSYRFMDLLVPNVDWVENGMGQFLLAFQHPDLARSIYQGFFRLEVPHDTIEAFEQIRKDRFLCRDEGYVTRAIAAVAPYSPDKVEALVAVAALSATRPDISKLIKHVVCAASEAEGRLAAAAVPAAPAFDMSNSWSKPNPVEGGK